MVLGIGHLAITVKDMEASLEFYTRVLGFKKAFEINNPETDAPWIVYIHVAGKQFIELFYGGEQENVWHSTLRGANHLCLEVDDIHTMAQQIEDAGYKLDKQPKFGCDNNWQCWVTDPDGVRIELMQLGEESPHMRVIKANG